MADRSASRSAIAVETRPVGPVAGESGAAGAGRTGTTAVDAGRRRPPAARAFGTAPVGAFGTEPVTGPAERRAGRVVAAVDGWRGRGG